MGRLRTIILDDNEAFRVYLHKMLERFEYVEIVKEVGTEDAALAAVEKLRPHLLISDIRLGGIGGFVLACMVRELFPETDVVLVTLYDNPTYRRKAEALGLAYIPKKKVLKLLPPRLEKLRAKRTKKLKLTVNR